MSPPFTEMHTYGFVLGTYLASLIAAAAAQTCHITTEQRWPDIYNSLDPKWSTVSRVSSWVWPANYVAYTGATTDPVVQQQLGICTGAQVWLKRQL